MARRLSVRDLGTSLSFAGSNAKVQISDNADIKTNSISVACWVYLRQSTGTVNFVRKFSTSGFSFRINGGAYKATINNGSNVIATSTTTPILARWHFVTMTYNSVSGTVSFYINGALDKTQTSGGGNIVWDTDSLYLGQDSGLASPCYGYLTKVRMWGSELTAAQVANLYYDDIVPSGLTGEWLFNEGSGATAFDTSGFGHNGTIAGATYSTFVPISLRPLA